MSFHFGLGPKVRQRHHLHWTGYGDISFICLKKLAGENI
jgi:hypothetical protein